MAQQFLLRGTSLEDLARQAAEQYGPSARIVRAERVLDDGLGGLLGRRHIEVTVHVPGAGEPRVVAVAPAVEPVGPHVLRARGGIAALLEETERTEDALSAAGSPPAQHRDPVSTQATSFDALLDRLRHEVDPGRVPSPLAVPGSLVLVAGLEATAAAVVRTMARRPHEAALWTLFGAGEPGRDAWPYLAGYGDAASARALAFEDGGAALVAFSLGAPSAGLPHLEAAVALGADQIWLVVDARHKHEDTAAWAEVVRGRLAVDALAVVGAGETSSAHSVNRFGIPLGWVDGSPAPRTAL